MIILGLG